MKRKMLFAAGTVAFVITGWSVVGFWVDLLGLNILNTSKHFVFSEFAASIVFGSITYFCFSRANKIKPAKD